MYYDYMVDVIKLETQQRYEALGKRALYRQLARSQGRPQWQQRLLTHLGQGLIGGGQWLKAHGQQPLSPNGLTKPGRLAR